MSADTGNSHTLYAKMGFRLCLFDLGRVLRNIILSRFQDDESVNCLLLNYFVFFVSGLDDLAILVPFNWSVRFANLTLKHRVGAVRYCLVSERDSELSGLLCKEHTFKVTTMKDRGMGRSEIRQMESRWQVYLSELPLLEEGGEISCCKT